MPTPDKSRGPIVVKPHRYPRDLMCRLILKARHVGASEDSIDAEIASLEWSDSIGRMWRYIALQMGAPRTVPTGGGS